MTDPIDAPPPAYDGRDLGRDGLTQRLARGGNAAGDVEIAATALKHGWGDLACLAAQRAVAKDESMQAGHLLLAQARLAGGLRARAIRGLQTALRKAGESPALLNLLGMAHAGLQQYSEAENAWTRAMARDPSDSTALCNLATMLCDTARADEAMALIEPAAQKLRDDIAVQRTAAIISNYAPALDITARYQAHRRYGRAMEHRAPAAHGDFPNTPDPGRRIRIGYVSADFKQHSVAYFLLPIIEHHCQDSFDLTAYSTTPQPDAVTQAFRSCFPRWRDAKGLSPSQLLQQVRADRIDILIDLGGLFQGSSHALFVRRAAPVQIAYLGYPNTTGLQQMDARVVDAETDPSGSENHSAERLIRLEHGFLLYRGDTSLPGRQRSAALDPTSPVTLGCFNRLAKLNAYLIGGWAAVLHALPHARLMIKAAGANSTEVRSELAAMFELHGLGMDRVTLLEATSTYSEHMALYEQVDIALDTFPYHGTTTTCEAMWMGVPVVTQAGDSHVSRVGVSLMKQVGLESLVAISRDAWVESVVRLAHDRRRLVSLQSTLRDRLIRSPLCDPSLFMSSYEGALREAWRDWCMK